MTTFGTYLRQHRRQCRDPLRGGMLTQERLGELLGHALGDAGYSGAAVSEWERDRSRINADHRLVLVGLISVLHAYGGLNSPDEARKLLHAGNYRDLNGAERKKAFPDLPPAVESERRSAQVGIAVAEAAPAPNPAPDLSDRRAKQHILLQKVNQFWVEGVLQRAVPESFLLDIAWEPCDEAVDQPWSDVAEVYLPLREKRPVHASLGELFVAADRALLILGAPGAGKTIALVRLAQELITQALEDDTRPIPVILNLASWAANRSSLAEWITKELTEKYQIPRQLGQSWLENDELLLLLDGLDNVTERHQGLCVAAINAFRQTRGLTGMVVCSRRETYEQLGLRLKLSGAVLLQPLSTANIARYLETVLPSLPDTRRAQLTTRAFAEMARSPLVLSVMTQVISENPEANDAELESWSQVYLQPGAQSQEIGFLDHLFSAYVAQMFQRQVDGEPYPREQTVAWLAWLAKRLHEHNMTTFLIEQIQPSWLPSDRWRVLYMFFSRLADGLYFGFLMWLLILDFRQIVPLFSTGLSAAVGGVARLPGELSRLVAMEGINLLLGLLVALIYLGLFATSGPRESRFSPRRRRRQHTVVVGVLVGLATFGLVYLFGDPSLAFAWGTAEALLFGLFARYSYGSDYRDEIRTAPPVSWSWPAAFKGAAIGILVSAIAELIEIQQYGDNGYVRTLVTFAFGAFLLGGLTGQRLTAQVRSNQGIWFSIRNSLVAALFAGTATGLVTGLVFSDLQSGLLTSAFMVTLVLPLYGGNMVARHVLLRFFLWRQGLIPGRFRRFLAYAEASTLLYRVGGGYIFIHPLFQDYFRTKG